MKPNKEFISEAFYNVYQRKWKSQGKSQEEFAKAVREIDPECGINKTYVSKLLNGIYTPSAKYLNLFCKVLNVDMQEFYPVSIEDKYRYSPDYQDSVSEWNDRVAKECFGLNLSFLYGLKQLIDFDNEFPLFANLKCSVTDPVNGFPFGMKYERVQLYEAAEANHGNGLFQVASDGKVFNLSLADMEFLKAVQNYLVRKTLDLFNFHKQELIDSMNEASEKCMDHLRQVKMTDLGQNPLSPDELQKIDKWGFYIERKFRKYKIPDPPEELKYISAYTDNGFGEIHFGNQMDVKPVNEWFRMMNDGRELERVHDSESISKEENKTGNQGR